MDALTPKEGARSQLRAKPLTRNRHRPRFGPDRRYQMRFGDRCESRAITNARKRVEDEDDHEDDYENEPITSPGAKRPSQPLERKSDSQRHCFERKPD
jgi:hypothetical protein